MTPLRGAIVVALMAWIAAPQASGVYTRYAEISPILTTLADVLPVELKTATARDATWDAWLRTHDQGIRLRLERGDDDTIVNWLLLGTTFTSHPRAAVAASPANTVQIPAVAVARTHDLVEALRAPGSDERRLFARRLLERKGYAFETAAQRERVADYLLSEIARFAREHEALNRDLLVAQQLGNASDEFAARSRMYRARGLSLDTSLFPSYALERTLAELRSRGLLKVGHVREVAVIGPGLDFSDKSSGYDFYPQQTLQPFALIDSLVRVGLAKDRRDVRVTTLDLSARVNEHLASARTRASIGQPYAIRLPLDAAVAWTPELVSYWRLAGEHIAPAASSTTTVLAGRRIDVRTIAVGPETVLQVSSEDTNIVVQRLATRQFDVVVATNVFVYYDLLDQALAAANIAMMLRPGGLLLSNNAILELPTLPLRSVGYLSVAYSNRDGDGDHIVWYQRS